jgi:hypothetical protein
LASECRGPAESGVVVAVISPPESQVTAAEA